MNNPGIRTLSEVVKETPAEKVPRRHFLVIDDDPTFRALIKRLGEKQGFEVTTFSSLKEISVEAVPRDFDVVILDYYLDDLQDHLRGTDVALALESTPILLVSSQDRCLDESDGAWPTNIRQFMNKKLGPGKILESAANLAKAV